MYVVAGVSGNTGKVVADTLLASKQAVRVIVRSADKGAPWRERGAEVAVAELDDVAALGRALAGAKGAYLLLPPQYASTDTRSDNARRTAGFVKAVDASSIPSVVFLSSVGAQHEGGTGPITSLHDAEVALRRSRASVTFVRAAYFMENWGGSLHGLAQGKLPTFLRADRTIPMVAAADIGRTAATALLEATGKGHSVLELFGPRDYSPRDVAEALGRVVGKTIVTEQGPEEAMVPALTAAGLNAHWAGLFQELTHGCNVGHVAFEGGAARPLRGKVEIDVVLRSLVGA
jgi:uncharacterized protein YbjT (DUF2867 family)